MDRVAFRTLPATHRKVEPFQCVATTGASLTGWIPLVYFDKTAPIPCCLVFQLPDDLTPAAIADSLCELWIFDHVLDLQTFHTNELVFLYQLCGQFVLKILTTVSNFGVNFGNFQFCFSKICRAFLLLTQTTLILCQLRFILIGVFGITGFNTFRGNNAVFNAKVNTDTVFRSRKAFYFLAAKQRNKVASGRVFRNSDSGWPVWNVSTPTDIQRFFVLGKSQLSIVPFESGTGVFSTLVSTLLFESRVICPTFPEVLEAGLEVSECLLGRDTGNVIQPRKVRVFLQRSQSTGRLVVSDSLALVVPSIGTQPQSPVINKAYTAERMSQLLLLFCCWVKPEFVRLLNHVHTIAGFCVISNFIASPNGLVATTPSTESTGFLARLR